MLEVEVQRLFKNAVLGVGLLIGATAPTFAGYTQINAPVGEETHAEIFSYIYGGHFIASGYDYTNGSITAHRVEDYASTAQASVSAAQSLVGDPGTNDQFFNANYVYAQADAKFAVNSQNFGYINNTNQYTKVFDQTGWGYNVGETYSSSLTAASGQTIRFARNGNNNILFSSNPADNVDHRDHMVTYEIDGLSTSNVTSTPIRTWMLFFEDAPLGSQVADFDFNDLVVEVDATAVTVGVPEPTTFALLPLGLLALRRRRA